MPRTMSKIKPLSPLDIKIMLLKSGTTQKKLADQWGVNPLAVMYVINRYPNRLYPEIRRKLADFLQVPVEAVGIDPPQNPKSKVYR